MTDDILTEEDSPLELLQWKLDRTAEEAARQVEQAKHAWARVRDLQHQYEELEERLHRMTGRMTVDELRRVGVRVDLSYDEED